LRRLDKVTLRDRADTLRERWDKLRLLRRLDKVILRDRADKLGERSDELRLFRRTVRVAFLPPVARDFAALLRFCDLVRYFDAPDSCSAMAIACLRLFTLPPLPPLPLLSSPRLYSCMTRPAVLRCRGVDLAIIDLLRCVPALPFANATCVDRFH
jgi:hypothetical protein